MKKIQYTKIAFIASTIWMVACTSDLGEDYSRVQRNEIHTIQITASNFDGAETLSRTSVSIEYEGAKFAWAETDTLGIFPNVGNQTAFSMKTGAGAQTAVFDGGGWALKSGSEYAAYFPFRYENDSQESIAITYAGQYQNGNGNTGHLGKYDYMATRPVAPNDGKVSFDFNHLGTLLQWNLKFPDAVNLTSLSVVADEALFIKNGTFSLKDDSQSIMPTETIKVLDVGLGMVQTTGTNQEVIVYMMMAPVDLTGKLYKVKVYDDTGKCAEVELEGKNFEKGKAYALSAEFTEFVEERLHVDEYVGKVISMEGGEITLDTPSNNVCSYILSDEAKEWITLISSSQGSFVFQVHENDSTFTRRGLVRIKDLVDEHTIEYAILQGGQGSYAIMESTARMPMGVLTSNAPAVSEEHGLWTLVDSDLETYFEANLTKELHISWEGPYDISISSVEYGRVAGNCGMAGMTFHIATDGTDWDGLGWSIGFGETSNNEVWGNPVTCRNRFYKLIVTENNGGPTTQVSEFGVTYVKYSEKDITSLNDLIIFTDNFTSNPATPLGNYFVDVYKTTDADRVWLSDVKNEPKLVNSDQSCSFREYEVNLYPYDAPCPADVNCRHLSDYPLAAALAEMAYIYPNFVKSIISKNSNNVYTVKMYDPQGNRINVMVKSTFWGNDLEMKAISGKDGKANWATIIEKAIMKWNSVYKISENISGFGVEHVFPILTGNGTSFVLGANKLSPKQLSQAVSVVLKEGIAVIGVPEWRLHGVGGIEGGRPYSIMYSDQPYALFAMRNPYGQNPNGTETDDGLLHIMADSAVPYGVELKFFYPGDAANYVEKKLAPYIPNY